MASYELFVDGHLDLAMNAMLYERDLRCSLGQIRQREVGLSARDAKERGFATVSLGELRSCARVTFVCATLIARCRPWTDPARTILRDDLDFPDATMAHATAHGQLAWYNAMVRQGHAQWIRTREDLQRLRMSDSAVLGLLLMMEGADAILDVHDLHRWYELGLRTVSLAHFGRSLSAAGTPSSETDAPEGLRDGPLTELGRQLLAEMQRLGMMLDMTHLGDTSFAQITECYEGAVCATHSAARGIASSSRQLTDSQLGWIVQHGGVIGLPLHKEMLRPDGEKGEVNLEHWADHAEYVCDIAGNRYQVALGSDLDGGFGTELAPSGFDCIGEVPERLATTLARRNWSDQDIQGVLGDNWYKFWEKNLPE